MNESTLTEGHLHPFLQQLNERHRMLLASGLQPFRCEPGGYLAREGEPAGTFYLIQTGHCAIEATNAEGEQIAVQTIGPDEVVGWSWIEPPYVWQFSCRAIEPVSGVKMDGSWLREKCEQDFSLGYYFYRNLIRVIAGRLTSVRLRGNEIPEEAST